MVRIRNEIQSFSAKKSLSVLKNFFFDFRRKSLSVSKKCPLVWFSKNQILKNEFLFDYLKTCCKIYNKYNNAFILKQALHLFEIKYLLKAQANNSSFPPTTKKISHRFFSFFLFSRPFFKFHSALQTNSYLIYSRPLIT